MKDHVNKGIEMEPPNLLILRFAGFLKVPKSSFQPIDLGRMWTWNLGFPTEVRCGKFTRPSSSSTWGNKHLSSGCCLREIAGEMEEYLPNSYAFQLISIGEVSYFTNLSMWLLLRDHYNYRSCASCCFDARAVHGADRVVGLMLPP